MPDSLSDLFDELVLANRILANEGVLDAFGHVSVRHPKDPGRYLLARSRAPALVVSEDILEYTLDSEPVKPPVARPVTERTIHGCIYAARSDVMAVCHHHAPAVLPFCVAGKPIVPVFHLGATIGEATPLWDQQDEFGDTNLLVANNDEGRSLARALGRHPVVLMRRHGATVVGGSFANWSRARSSCAKMPSIRCAPICSARRRCCIRGKRGLRAKATSLPGCSPRHGTFITCG